MPEGEALYERRRYSAVVVSHPGLRTYRDVQRHATGRLNKAHPLRPVDGWSLRRVGVLDGKSHYPVASVPATSVAGREGFAHDCYIAVRDSLQPLVLVASPYRLLLSRFVQDLTHALAAPRPQFLSVNVGALFDRLARGHEHLRATRISVQTAGEPGVALVSLSGVSPLQSGLWGDIRERVTPYGARIEHTTDEDPARVNADRVGNFFWFQLEEAAVGRVCATISYLEASNLTTQVALSPLRRGGAEEDESQ